MLATVSARIPVEVRNQVHKKLRNSGTTPSKFINDVYVRYLEGDLSLEDKDKNSDKKSSSSSEEILDLFRRTTCNYDNPLPESFDFKSELEHGRLHDYETLAWYVCPCRFLSSERKIATPEDIVNILTKQGLNYEIN